MLRVALAQFYYLWGSLHRNFGNQTSFAREHLAAVRCFERAYELNPALREARLSRGIILWRELGRPEEALADFDALVAADAFYGPARLNRAMARQELGRYSEALADLTAFLALPDQAEEYRQVASRTQALLKELLAG
jgi:tetratricopeptide (TPR) repeat protein